MLFMLRFLPFLEELVRRAARGIVQAHFTFGTKGGGLGGKRHEHAGHRRTSIKRFPALAPSLSHRSPQGCQRDRATPGEELRRFSRQCPTGNLRRR